MARRFRRRRPSEIDSVSAAAVGITFPHHEVHEGDSFTVTLSDIAMGNNDTIILAWKTGAAPKRMHLVAGFSAKVAGNLQIWEGATWTAETGADVPILNRNRSSSNSSFVLADAAQAGFVAADVMHGNPTGLNVGSATSLVQVFAQAPQSTMSQTRDRDTNEFVEAADTQYAAVFTATGATNGGSITLDWYEHSDSEA